MRKAKTSINQKRKLISILFILPTFLLLFLFIIVTKTIFTRRETKIKESVILKLKSYEVKEIDGKIKIPYFDYELLDKEIADFLNEHNNKNILVDYSVNFTENLLNIFLTIKHQNNYYYKSILYDLDKLKFTDANKVIDLKVTSDVILNKIKNKYCKKIYEKIIIVSQKKRNRMRPLFFGGMKEPDSRFLILFV